MMKLILGGFVTVWTIFMLTQVVQAIADYGMYSMLLVTVQIVIWFALAWFPFWLLVGMD